MPGCKQISESALSCFSKIGDDTLEINGSLKLWFAGQIPGNDSLLMKVAHLYRSIGKKPVQASFAVYCYRLNLKALPDEGLF